MTPASARYLAGLAAVAAATAAVSRALAPGLRLPMTVALALALTVQAPLGWWLIRSVGTETRRFLAAWAIGLAARVGLLGVAAVVVVPLGGWAPGVVLLPLAALLLALLGVESVVLLLGHAGNGVR